MNPSIISTPESNLLSLHLSIVLSAYLNPSWELSFTASGEGG